MTPLDYSTFAAYWGNDGKVIFGLTNHDFTTDGWINPSAYGITSLDYALTVDEKELRVSLARALMNIVLDSNRPLQEDLHPMNSSNTSLDMALYLVFWNPDYRTKILNSEPKTIGLPGMEGGTGLGNLTDRLKGELKIAYTQMVQSLLHRIIVIT